MFAASTDNGVVKLYDARQYDAGPFDSFAVASAPGPPLESLRFSVDGKLLIAAGGGFVFVLDAYSGSVRGARAREARERARRANARMGALGRTFRCLERMCASRL